MRLMMRLMTSRVQNVDKDDVGTNIGTRMALLGIRSFIYHHCIVDCWQPSPTRSEKSVSSSSSSSQNIKPAPPPPAVTQEPHKKLSRGSFVSVGRLTERQLKKLRRDIEITERHLEVFSELLSEVVPGQVGHPLPPPLSPLPDSVLTSISRSGTP